MVFTIKDNMKHFTTYKNTPKQITTFARNNRSNQTPAEEKLWSRISKRQLNGIKFRRQFPIGKYIVDFYSHAKKLVIEIDGYIHDEKHEYDKNRDQYLTACGYTVLRFPNSEIGTNIETVLQEISEHFH